MEKPHKRLDVWHKSVDFVIEIYRITKEFPADERYGLVSQMRRAAVSIPSNLAEGAAKGTNEYIQCIRIAIGSEVRIRYTIRNLLSTWLFIRGFIPKFGSTIDANRPNASRTTPILTKKITTEHILSPPSSPLSPPASIDKSLS